MQKHRQKTNDQILILLVPISMLNMALFLVKSIMKHAYATAAFHNAQNIKKKT